MLDTALGLNTETDAFGNQTIVTVAAGATLDDSWATERPWEELPAAATSSCQSATECPFNDPSRRLSPAAFALLPIAPWRWEAA